jgi:hypothetical protein
MIPMALSMVYLLDGSAQRDRFAREALRLVDEEVEVFFDFNFFVH